MQLYSFLNLGASWGWVVNATPRQLYPRERPGIHCIGGWVGPRAGLDRCGKSRAHRDSIPERPGCSQSLYRQSYPAHIYIYIYISSSSSSSSSSCSGRIRFDSCFLYPQNEIGPSISSSLVLCVFVLLVYIVVLVQVSCLCPSICMCCSHFSWYCFVSFTIFSAPVFSLIHWFFFIQFCYSKKVSQKFHLCCF